MLTTWTTIPMLDRLLTDVMNDVTGTAFGTKSEHRGSFQPAIDVRANDEEIVFVCDVPGLREEDLDVTLENSTLTLRGQRSYDGHAQRQGVARSQLRQLHPLVHAARRRRRRAHDRVPRRRSADGARAQARAGETASHPDRRRRRAKQLETK